MNMSRVKSPFILLYQETEFCVWENHFYHEKVDFNLISLLKGGKLSYSENIGIFYQLVQGIKAFHQ